MKFATLIASHHFHFRFRFSALFCGDNEGLISLKIKFINNVTNWKIDAFYMPFTLLKMRVGISHKSFVHSFH